MKLFVRQFRKSYAVNSNLILYWGHKEVLNQQREITGMNPKPSFGNRFRSKLRGIKYLLMRYNSTNKLPFAMLMKFESHYPPLRFRNWSFNNKNDRRV